MIFEVGHIKLRFLTILLFMLIIASLFSITIPERCKADDQVGVYIVGDPTYRLTNSIVKKNRIIGQTYQVNVTLHNSGNSRSEELTVNLTDATDSLAKKTYLEPGETQIVSFTWSTLIIKNQRLIINFYPSDLDALWTEYNSGSKSLTVKIEESSGVPATSTPGFEIILLFAAIICIIFFKKKRI